MRSLLLEGNALEALPAGLFEGLGALEEVRLSGNPGAPFALAVELERADAEPWSPGPASLSARVRGCAPFALEAPTLTRSLGRSKSTYTPPHASETVRAKVVLPT